MAAFVGKFKLNSQENLDEYLKAIGVGMALRVMAKAATPVTEFAIDGDQWTITTTGMREKTEKFNLGVQIDTETLDGRKVKVTFTLESPNKLLQTEVWKDKTTNMTWEVNGDDLTLTILLDNVRCIRKYKRI